METTGIVPARARALQAQGRPIARGEADVRDAASLASTYDGVSLSWASRFRSSLSRSHHGERPQITNHSPHAWRVLDQGDHYILVMINEAVGKQLKPW
jgi:hypothetical protein